MNLDASRDWDGGEESAVEPKRFPPTTVPTKSSKECRLMGALGVPQQELC